jgi:hypothetical protein
MSRIIRKKLRIPPAVRREVATRYGAVPGTTVPIKCAYCGVAGRITWFQTRRDGSGRGWPAFAGFHMDHVVPEARGGAAVAANIVLACPRCNKTKGVRAPQEWCAA